MKTRIVHTKIWDDEWFQELSNEAQKLFIYLITCQDISICGAFELPDRKIVYHTKIAELQKAKEELSGKVFFHEGWVVIYNVDKYNSYKGEKNDKARERELFLVPEVVSKEYLRGMHTSIDTSIYTTLNHNHNLNHNLNPNRNNTKEQKKEVWVDGLHKKKLIEVDE